jgi:hypothetical protein
MARIEAGVPARLLQGCKCYGYLSSKVEWITTISLPQRRRRGGKGKMERGKGNKEQRGKRQEKGAQ